MDSDNIGNSCLFLGIIGMNIMLSSRNKTIERNVNKPIVHKIPRNLSITSDISIGAASSIDISLSYDNFCDVGKLFLDTIHYTSIFTGAGILCLSTYYIILKPLLTEEK